MVERPVPEHRPFLEPSYRDVRSAVAASPMGALLASQPTHWRSMLTRLILLAGDDDADGMDDACAALTVNERSAALLAVEGLAEALHRSMQGVR